MCEISVPRRREQEQAGQVDEFGIRTLGFLGREQREGRLRCLLRETNISDFP